MRVGITRAVATASLLLVALVATGVAPLVHAHDGLIAADSHGDLPRYSAGHEQPDRRVHVEAASRLETSSCVACISRQRQHAETTLVPGATDFAPSTTTVAHQSPPHPLGACYRLPPPRAPPRA